MSRYSKKCVQQWLVHAFCEIGDLSDFQNGQIMGAYLAGASVTLTARLFSVLRSTVFTIVTAHKAWQDFVSEDNSGKRSKLNNGILRRIVSKQHRNAAAKVTANLSIYCTLNTLFPQKTSDNSTKPTYST